MPLALSAGAAGGQVPPPSAFFSLWKRRQSPGYSPVVAVIVGEGGCLRAWGGERCANTNGSEQRIEAA